MPRLPSSHLPPSPGPRGVAGRLVGIARAMRIEHRHVLKGPAVGPPPPPPPSVARPTGIAALMPRKAIPLPPKPISELPPPPVVPRPIGLAARIPPMERRLLARRRPAP